MDIVDVVNEFPAVVALHQENPRHMKSINYYFDRTIRNSLMFNAGVAVAIAVLVSGCAVTTLQEAKVTVPTAQEERDELFMLLAYSVVHRDWQSDSNGGDQRGHNIGGILVDSRNQIVNWARNCNAITNNGSQHGEVRLIRSYLRRDRSRSYLDGYTVYTSLEPCAMCTGMMCLTKLDRCVYGQKDPGYGNALERLALDSSRRLGGGYKPYPRLFESEGCYGPTTTRMNQAYLASGEENITKWLRSDEAEAIYRDAFERLKIYDVRHDENRRIKGACLQFLHGVPSHYQRIVGMD